ncbi:MAG TPA: hypothetical protein VF669_16245 [Tepidisphaeraceae bacterium]|jgi:hypothetical protein
MTLPTMQEETVPNVCKCLRTKTAFGSFSETGKPPWQSGESTTAVYWCLVTMSNAGPDDRFCHPHNCQEGRGCFRCEG